MTDGQPLRVGVTGHRHLASPSDVRKEVDGRLDRLLSSSVNASLVAVSSLAEGADRIVAERVLARPGSTLHAVLPLHPADYAADFADEMSRAEFEDLLERAERVEVSSRQDSRDAAYEHAGRIVLAECDVLLALWDEQPSRGRGGTAQLVVEATGQGKPVEIVHVERAADAPAP